MERQASAPCRQSVLSARDKTFLHALLIGRGCNVTLPQCTAGFHYPTENLDCVDGEAHLLGRITSCNSGAPLLGRRSVRTSRRVELPHGRQRIVYSFPTPYTNYNEMLSRIQ